MSDYTKLAYDTERLSMLMTELVDLSVKQATAKGKPAELRYSLDATDVRMKIIGLLKELQAENAELVTDLDNSRKLVLDVTSRLAPLEEMAGRLYTALVTAHGQLVFMGRFYQPIYDAIQAYVRYKQDGEQ